MVNFLASLILLGITVFILTLFPGGKDLLGDITNTFNLKKANVVEEYERVKDEVSTVTGAVGEVTEKVGTAVKTVGEAAEATSEAIDKVNGILGEEEESETEENETDEAPEKASAE